MSKFTRIWPPAAGAPSVNDALKVFSEFRMKESPTTLFSALEEELKLLFGARSVYFSSSGKASLYQCFQSLRRQGFDGPVVLGAYACPDIAAAALKAGCQIFLADVSSKTLDLEKNLDEAQLKKGICVFANLYGLADDIASWADVVARNGMAVVDDACQSALNQTPDSQISLHAILSFGRGKAIYGCGGGAWLLPAGEKAPHEFKNKATVSEIFVNYCRARFTEVFEQPEMYGIPARLPFLGLGKTVYHEDFSTEGLEAFQAAAALVQVRRFMQTREMYLQKTSQWKERLRGTSIVQPMLERNVSSALIRYPILVSRESLRNKIFHRLSRLGLSCAYPKPLHHYAQIQKALANSRAKRTDKLSGSEIVAQTILTLPTHKYVTEEVFDKIVKILREET